MSSTRRKDAVTILVASIPFNELIGIVLKVPMGDKRNGIRL